MKQTTIECTCDNCGADLMQKGGGEVQDMVVLNLQPKFRDGRNYYRHSPHDNPPERHFCDFKCAGQWIEKMK